ncbi:hypothetical protein [Phytohabitans aurantiacus]|uniref:Ig-like domain-containing protein n=1 Tax=Phytohabitans aurantiacus TaxID=3016789 RepID=A0ABQ5QZR3_9ACTN|nr:hypothetical protein [Phytohabitans aurantiacus]GLH99402.1 hypothetical protein Pa4123_46780 [Phytohabitans aurantiacus]
MILYFVLLGAVVLGTIVGLVLYFRWLIALPPGRRTALHQFAPAPMFVVLFCGVAGIMLGLDIETDGMDPLTDREIRAGRPCGATVLSVSDPNRSTSKGVDTFDFKLRVRPLDGTPYEVDFRDEVNAVEAGRIGTPGAEFRCVADRDEPSRLHVFWLEPASTSPTVTPT